MRKSSLVYQCHSPGEGEHTNILQYSHLPAASWKSPLLLSCFLTVIKLTIPWEFTLLVLALGWQGMKTHAVLLPYIVLQCQMHEAMLYYPNDTCACCCPALACKRALALLPCEWTLTFIKWNYLECLRFPLKNWKTSMRGSCHTRQSIHWQQQPFLLFSIPTTLPGALEIAVHIVLSFLVCFSSLLSYGEFSN